MLFDTHVHTQFSFDSNASLAQMLASANAKGLGICTTEHLDLNFQEVAGFEIDFDIEAYFKRYEPYRGAKYLMGIEMGLDMDDLDAVKAIGLNHSFDVVVGSLHTMHKKDLSHPKTYQDRNQGAFYRSYLQYAREVIEAFSFIDVLAHIDYPTRYSGYTRLFYEDYPEEFDALFQVLVQKKISLEFNTKTPLNKEALASYRSIFRGYRDCGGQYVTLASDAHRAEEIGRDFDEAIKLMDELNLTICYYKNRRRTVDADHAGMKGE